MLAENEIVEILNKKKNAIFVFLQALLNWKLSKDITLSFLFVIFIIAVCLRLFLLNTDSSDSLNNSFIDRTHRMVYFTSMRGSIIDRNGAILAITVPASSIWVDSSLIGNVPYSTLVRLSELTSLPTKSLLSIFNNKSSHFHYLVRQTSPKLAKLVMSLKIHGIYSKLEMRRYYPYGNIDSQLVGLDNIDNIGLSGLEKRNDTVLSGHNGIYKIIKSGHGKVIGGHIVKKVSYGNTLQLSIDNNLQYITYHNLMHFMSITKALSGAVVIIDANTGEILSMVSAPSFDPNNRNYLLQNTLVNNAISNFYDPGSTIKPLLVAKALDLGLIHRYQEFNVHPFYVGSKRISDYKPYDKLSVNDIIVHSSDVGISKIALLMTKKEIWSFYRLLGFNENKVFGRHGVLRNWHNWSLLDQVESSFGYGFTINLLELARSYTIFTHHGCLLPLSIYKNHSKPVQCIHILSANTTDFMNHVLYDTVQNGTAKSAQVHLIPTAGKTGTSQKYINHHYSHTNYYASFVGFAPVNKPKIIVAVLLDSPKGSYYASQTAAPLFAKIVSASLNYFQL